LKIKNWAWWVVIGFVALYILVFSTYSVLLHEIFWTQAFDAGIEDQGIWLLSRFLVPFDTVRGLNIFGDSCNLYDLFLAPLFWIWNNINFLFIIQSFFLALGAIPLFVYAREKLGHNYLALSVAFSYLLYPALQNLNLDQFHPEALVVLPMVLTLFFLFKKEYKLFYVFLLISLIGKDEVALTGLFIGIFLLLFKREWRHGFITIVISLLWCIVCSKIFAPFYNGVSILGPQPITYTHWFRGLAQNLFNWQYYWSNIFHIESLRYYNNLFAPLAFLPFFSPALVFMAIPSIAVNVLSGTGYLRSVDYHYNYVQCAVLFFALIGGLEFWLKRKWPWSVSQKVKIWVLLAAIWLPALAGNHLLSHLPFDRAWGMTQDRIKDYYSDGVKNKQMAVSLIPAGAKVSASYSLVPHFSHRREIYMFPNPFYPALWGQWFQEGRNFPGSNGHVDFVAVDLNNHGDKERDLIYFLAGSPAFKIIYKKESLLILQHVDSLKIVVPAEFLKN